MPGLVCALFIKLTEKPQKENVYNNNVEKLWAAELREVGGGSRKVVVCDG